MRTRVRFRSSFVSNRLVLHAGFLVALALVVAGCAKGGQIEWESPVERAHPLVGRIWDVKAGAFIGEDALVARLVASRFVLLGERHDNADHPALQAKLVRAMVEAGRRPALGFEMLATAQAPAIARSLARAGQRDGAVLIAGAGHVRRDRGVPVHLARQAPDASIASVAFVEVDAAAVKPGDYAKAFGSDALPFDYVWFTPKVDDADPCEKLKKATETETIGK